VDAADTGRRMERAMRVEEVFNQSPPYVDVDLYASDRPLQNAVAANGGEHDAAALSAFGKHWGTAEMFDLARAANEHPPELKAFDARGNRRDVVEFHPAYHHFMAESVAAGLAASTWREDARPTPAPAQVTRAARFYMAAQVETGHLCPITMTHAAVAALAVERALVAKFMPKIMSRRYDPRFRPWWEKRGITLGMGMTEKQGGTDVRTNTTRAEPAAEGYMITGHKWFMSAPMCDAFLVLAQAQGGLTCFLMPRFRPDGSVNGLSFQRLKDKLGNRSNASSEVEFVDAFAWRVGEEGRGVRTIINMVQLTRLDCAIASAGLMRMALAQAIHHARFRTVFQKHLVDQPMMRAVLADMALEVEAATALTLRLARAFDLAEADPREAARAAAHAGGEILGVQARARLDLRGDGVSRRQRLCRGEHVAAPLSRGAGQRDLGRLRQRDVSRRAAGARPGPRSRARGAGGVGRGGGRSAGCARDARFHRARGCGGGCRGRGARRGRSPRAAGGGGVVAAERP